MRISRIVPVVVMIAGLLFLVIGKFVLHVPVTIIRICLAVWVIALIVLLNIEWWTSRNN